MNDEDWRSDRFSIQRFALSFFSSLAVNLPTDKIPAGGRFHFIRHRPLEDDLGPRVVGDFHQAGGQGELVAKGNQGIGDLEIWRFGTRSALTLC